MGYVDNWKEEYRNEKGIVMWDSKFLSLTGSGDGNRGNPANVRANVDSYIKILGGGRIKYFKTHLSQYYYLVGQGMDQTFVELDTTYNYAGPCLMHMTITGWNGSKTLGSFIYYGKLLTDLEHSGLHIRNSIVCADQTKMGGCVKSSIVGVKNVGKGFVWGTKNDGANLFDNCTFEFSFEDLNSRKDYYAAFNDCTFKIGDIERKLEGETADECRASFISLCEKAEIIPPVVNGVVMGNWAFANNSAIGGVIIKGSILDQFRKTKGVSIGYETADIKPIPLLFDQTQIGSLEESTAEGFKTEDNLVEGKPDGKIKLQKTFPLTERAELKVSSKVINLHGQKKMSGVNILDNLLSGYGMGISADHSLDETSVVINTDGKIESGKLEIGYKYLIRAEDRGYAYLNYNGSTYATNLNGYNFITAIADPKNPTEVLDTFTNVGKRIELYKVRSHELYQTLEMRIVDEISSDKITSGNLTSEYWYIVEGEEGGSVTVDNIKYPIDCSFLVRGSVKGVINSVDKAYLRKCFAEDYEYGSDSFYNDKQQPIWFKVVGNDMRCQHANDSIYDVEMKYDKKLGTYWATGHPHFYNSLKEVNGFRARAFPIKGKYVQFRLHVSSFNVM